jgi:hypothetical protein
VVQKQTEAIQRQAAVSAFVKRLQREQDLLRAEKERRLKVRLPGHGSVIVQAMI